jgi:hypothetical protein
MGEERERSYTSSRSSPSSSLFFLAFHFSQCCSNLFKDEITLRPAPEKSYERDAMRRMGIELEGKEDEKGGERREGESSTT